MKKITLLFFSLMTTLFALQANAQVVTIGTQVGTSAFLPIDGGWGYSYSQQLVYSNQINTAGNITSISFYFDSGGPTNSDNWAIYLGHTAKTSFSSNTDWVLSTSLVKVFDGDVTFPAGGNWMTINFTNSFPYNGMDNLVIAVDENKPGDNLNGGGTKFGKTANVGSYRSIIYRNDNTNPNPASPPAATFRNNYINNMLLGFAVGCPAGIPFTEDFENSYTDGADLGGCWSQESVAGTENWVTRTQSDTYNRSARSGSEYITLAKDNNDWIFYALDLEEDTYYELKFYAKQDQNESVFVRASYGVSSTAAAMVNTITNNTLVTDTYQEFSGIFTPPSTGTYYIGIKGKHQNPTGEYMSLDDVSVNEIVEDYVYEGGAWHPHSPSTDPSTTKSVLVVNGTADLVGDTYINNLSVKPGAKLSIKNVLYLTAGGDVINDGEIIFLSDEDADGELAKVSESSHFSGSGIVTMHKYMSGNRAYRIVSSSVNTGNTINHSWQEGVHNTGTSFPADNQNPNLGYGTHITGSKTGDNGFDATLTGNPSMYTVSTLTQEYEAIPNTDNIILKAGTPYLLYVRGDRSVDLTDNSAGDGVTTILRASGELAHGFHTQVYEVIEAGDFVMFGNPYQSAVNMETVFNNSSNVNDEFLYIYDPTFGTIGGWATVTMSTNTAGGEAVGSQANKYLQVGQGAQVASLGSGDVTIAFKQDDKAPGNHTQTSATGETLLAENMLTVQVFTTERYNTGGRLHDGFRMMFDGNFSNELDRYDAVKPFNFAENFGIDHDGTYLSVERREMPVPSETYQLYSTGYTQAEYTLLLTVVGLEDVSLYLDDSFTGTSTLLEAGDNTYDFSVSADYPLSKSVDRFSIRTEQRLGLEDNNMLSGIRLFPNPIDNNIFNISAPNLDGQTVEISINDMLGRQVFTSQPTFSGSTVKIDLAQELKSGVYMVTISSNGESQSLRVIKR
ncbi:T9SS type A sorting domain-containing protein [Aequorivita sp. H23M31]|uniref:T9SS type A sorting domain-containing protein n=1 Tax=Aequorivita ciconiae TaxID=2494375 RepID=A0A410G3D8_9FLAO|nr:T9SS type A sorting domain-containing protein [Aequorivita sp. H23M31]QAA81792.1 T9SS type A sorting domain-containing protein [Aequorivita sp. H23M31]